MNEGQNMKPDDISIAYLDYIQQFQSKAAEEEYQKQVELIEAEEKKIRASYTPINYPDFLG